MTHNSCHIVLSTTTNTAFDEIILLLKNFNLLTDQCTGQLFDNTKVSSDFIIYYVRLALYGEFIEYVLAYPSYGNTIVSFHVGNSILACVRGAAVGFSRLFIVTRDPETLLKGGNQMHSPGRTGYGEHLSQV